MSRTPAASTTLARTARPGTDTHARTTSSLQAYHDCESESHDPPATRKGLPVQRWKHKSVQYAQGPTARSRCTDPDRDRRPVDDQEVFLIARKPRPYDQVFGDDPSGKRRPGVTAVRRGRDAEPHAMEQQFRATIRQHLRRAATNSAEGPTTGCCRRRTRSTRGLGGRISCHRSYDTEGTTSLGSTRARLHVDRAPDDGPAASRCGRRIGGRVAQEF